MDFFRPISPAYKTAEQLSQVTMVNAPTLSSSLTGMFGSVFGGSTPAYKTVNGLPVQAQAAAGLWSIFGVTSPVYKTAPLASDVPLDEDDEAADECDPGPDKIVVL